MAVARDSGPLPRHGADAIVVTTTTNRRRPTAARQRIRPVSTDDAADALVSLVILIVFVALLAGVDPGCFESTPHLP